MPWWSGAVIGFAVGQNTTQDKFDTVMRSVNQELLTYCFNVEEQLVTKPGYSWPSGPCDRSIEPYSKTYITRLLDPNPGVYQDR